MLRRKTRQVKIKGNHLFVSLCILMCLILTGSIAFSICDKILSIIKWPCQYENTIGVSSQIITSIISLVVSIIGIAISLQNEDYFGVKIRKLYSLRVKYHYSILTVLIISIILCVINMAFYMLNLHIAAIGTAFVALMFLIQVLIAEIPIMTKNEKTMVQIIKDRYIFCYLKEKELPSDLKDALKYLLYKNTLKNVYSDLKDYADTEYNKHLLMGLLDIQQHLAKELEYSYEDNEQRKVADSLLNNVLDIIFRKIEITDEHYSYITQQRYLLTRVLFCIHRLPTMRIEWLNKVQGLTQCLEFAQADTVPWVNLLSEILIILVSHTVQEGDFSIIEAIRRQLSTNEYCLENESHILNVFVIISMYLYYLKCCDFDIPSNVKDKIQDFIEESGKIENKTRIISWKGLFSIAAEEFNVNYNDMVELSAKVSSSMEYYIFGIGTKTIVLDKDFFSRWYLTHLFNSRRIPEINYEELCNTYPDIKPHLKELGKKCVDENGEFSPTDEMNRIVTFYSNENEHFVWLGIGDEWSRNLFTVINSLRLEDLSNEAMLAKQIDNIKFANEIKSTIENEISQEWGFDPSLEIDNSSRYFSIIFEKDAEALNFKKFIIKYCVDSVFLDLKKALNKTELFNNGEFEKGIRNVLNKKPTYTTESVKNTIPRFFIKRPEIQELFLSLSDSMKEVKSRILGNMFLVIDDDFRFNLEVEKVEINQLSEEEIDKKVLEYQRADGQYVYDGVFMPRETITQYIKDRFVVLTVIIKYQMESYKDKIFKLRPYSKEPENQ